MRLSEIIQIMIEEKLIDPKRLFDTEYMVERISLYIKAKKFVDDNFKF